MSRILLADDSAHAQRMGEHILREEGFEVVSLTNGEAALARLADVDPDVILADVFLPAKSGVELCRYVKGDTKFQHVRVVLTAGLLEPFDEQEAKRAGCDAVLKKPFEASKLLAIVNSLVRESQIARGLVAEAPAPVAAPADAHVSLLTVPGETHASPLPVPTLEIDAERVRAAVTLALDAAMPTMIQEITERVLIALGH